MTRAMSVHHSNDPLRAPLQLRFLPEETGESQNLRQPGRGKGGRLVLLLFFAAMGGGGHACWQHWPQLRTKLAEIPQLHFFFESNPALPESAPANLAGTIESGELASYSYATKNNLVETAAHTLASLNSEQREPSKPMSVALADGTSHCPKLQPSAERAHSENSNRISAAALQESAVGQLQSAVGTNPTLVRDIGDDKPIRLSVYDAVPEGIQARPIVQVVRLLRSQQPKLRQAAFAELRDRGWSEDIVDCARQLAQGDSATQLSVLQRLDRERELDLRPWLEWMAVDGSAEVQAWSQARMDAAALDPVAPPLPQVVPASFASPIDPNQAE